MTQVIEILEDNIAELAQVQGAFDATTASQGVRLDLGNDVNDLGQIIENRDDATEPINKRRFQGIRKIVGRGSLVLALSVGSVVGLAETASADAYGCPPGTHWVGWAFPPLTIPKCAPGDWQPGDPLPTDPTTTTTAPATTTPPTTRPATTTTRPATTTKPVVTSIAAVTTVAETTTNATTAITTMASTTDTMANSTTSETTTSSTTSTAESSTSSSSSTTLSTIEVKKVSNNGLSSGEEIGILAGGAVSLPVLFFIIRRRRSSK